MKNKPELVLPGAEKAKAADAKFTGYLFNPNNVDGYAKGQAFTSRLGYDKNNWKDLQKQILQKAPTYPAKKKGDAGYGEKYEQKIVVYGNKWKPANVIVGWISDKKGTRMTSAYVKEVK